EIRTMQRRARLNQLVIGCELLAKIDSFFPVGITRGQFCADREVSSPCLAGFRHSDFKFRVGSLRKEFTTIAFEALLKIVVNTVAGNLEEAEAAARFTDARRDFVTFFGTRDQAAYIQDGNDGHWFQVALLSCAFCAK